MGLMRLGISKPALNTPTSIFTAGDVYLASVVATNMSSSTPANIRVWAKPSGATLDSEYAYIVYDIPVEQNNSYETFRFAINSGDEIYVQASTSNVSFQAYGLVQQDIKLGVGAVSWSPNAPSNPINGMIWVDSDGVVSGSSAKPIYIYDASTAAWVSTAASAIDTSANYNFTGSITIGNVSPTEISYLDGATSNIQNQINSVPSNFQTVMAQRMFG